MRKLIQHLLEQPVPLPPEIAAHRANCFNAVQLYWGDSLEYQRLGPEEFVAYMQMNFTQVETTAHSRTGDVTIVWSRSSPLLPQGSIHIEHLQKERDGYPFGLVIEHAYVTTENDMIFQKRDPTENGPYELISESMALSPYLAQPGFEITLHRRT